MNRNTLIDTVRAYRQWRYADESGLSESEFELIIKVFISLGASSGELDAKLMSIFSTLGGAKSTAIAAYGTQKDDQSATTDFLRDCAELQINKSLFDERIVGIAEHHFAGLPAPLSQGFSDTSLFSFLKFAAALQDASAQHNKESLVLIGCDLSGVQNFLYSIVSKHAAKNLKGRSFYLQLIIEDIRSEICLHFNIKPWQIIYSSGGGFYALSAKLPELEIQLSTVQDRRNLALFKEHGTALFVAIDTVEIENLIASGQEVGQLWKSLSRKLGQSKSARYGSLLVDHFDLFFGISGSAQPRVDHITGRVIKYKSVKLNLKTGAEEESREVAYSTKRQIDLGRRLKESDYWIIAKSSLDEHEHEHDGHSFTVPGSPFVHRFVNEQNVSDESNKQETVSVLAFDEAAYRAAKPYGYGGNKYPLLDTFTGTETNATYEQFAQSSSGEIERLGVLRMDVDNLGSAFISGFEKRTNVFPLVGELSMRLTNFFTHRINQIVASEPSFKSKAFIIYSGGDDLFVVGHWNVLINLAEKIHEQFQAYVSGDFLTLSAGLTFVTSKYPILKAAELAGDAEHRAKAYTRDVDTKGEKVKNAIDLFGSPVGWEEFKILKNWKDQWLDWFNQDMEGINRSLLHKLFDYRELKNTGNSLKWQWHAAYSLARRSSANNSAEIDKIKKLLFKGQNNYRELDLCCLGGRWADYLTRNQNK